VVFDAAVINPNQLFKSGEAWECKDLEPDYAHLIIDGLDHYPAVFRIDGKLYTQALKMAPGNHTVSRFLLMDDGGTPREVHAADDQIVMGIPETGSPYAVYVSKPVNFTVPVDAFVKTEVPVEVLCFQDNAYLEFGFGWFQVTEIVVREICFFGDFCVKDPSVYANSDYAKQSTGLQIDMPAIFKVVVKKNGAPVPNSPFTNASAAAGWGVGAPVCVEYPDNLTADGEVFTFELYIYVKSGNTFIFKKFHTWTLTDDETIVAGDDGVVDFVLGSCNLTAPDLQLAPYQDLPVTASINLTSPADPGYWWIYVNSVSPGGSYDLPVGVILTGWCGSPANPMANGSHTVNIYPSLYSTNWPAGLQVTLADFAKVNWLFNNLGLYGMSYESLTDAQGDILQDAIWNLLYGTPATGTALIMATDAAAHGNFVPLPGEWAAALFVKSNLPQAYQLIFTMLDP
jgi:hypothetical protein